MYSFSSMTRGVSLRSCRLSPRYLAAWSAIWTKPACWASSSASGWAALKITVAQRRALPDEDATGRPFTLLNQPIITATGAGGAAARDTLINDALARTAPGLGGDDPESAVEGLVQTATGIGFDGDGDGSTLDSGPAGLAATPLNPGTSGDVPAFSSNVAPTSGTLGAAGWRSDTLRLTILATDICPVAAFPAGASIPATITGAGAVSVPVSAFACSSTTPGDSRFGFVSNSKTTAGNTVSGAVVPSEAGTVQGTLDALNTLGIRVLGMGPDAGPTDSTGPATDASYFCRPSPV